MNFNARPLVCERPAPRSQEVVTSSDWWLPWLLGLQLRMFTSSRAAEDLFNYVNRVYLRVIPRPAAPLLFRVGWHFLAFVISVGARAGRVVSEGIINNHRMLSSRARGWSFANDFEVLGERIINNTTQRGVEQKKNGKDHKFQIANCECGKMSSNDDSASHTV